MKTYFIGLLLLMVGFTGFLFLKRPGALEELMSASKISPKMPDFNSGSKSTSQSSKKQYPYFSYVSGDVLLNTEAESYLAQTNLELRKNDHFMVSFHSTATIALGPEKYLRIGEGSKIRLTAKPRRNRGFYEFKLEKGRIFIDFFSDKNPIGIKIHYGDYSASLQDATFRMQTKEDGKFISSVDRGSVNLYLPKSGEVFSVAAGFGGHNQSGKIEVGEFDWIDDYPWEERIEQVTKKGYGVAATFKATPLSKRPQKVRKEDLIVKWKKDRRGRVRRKPSKVAKKVTSIMETVGKKATEGLKNVITAPTKISESQETIKNFESMQKQRAQQLDDIE